MKTIKVLVNKVCNFLGIDNAPKVITPEEEWAEKAVEDIEYVRVFIMNADDYIKEHGIVAALKEAEKRNEEWIELLKKRNGEN